MSRITLALATPVKPLILFIYPFILLGQRVCSAPVLILTSAWSSRCVSLCRFGVINSKV